MRVVTNSSNPSKYKKNSEFDTIRFLLFSNECNIWDEVALSLTTFETQEGKRLCTLAGEIKIHQMHYCQTKKKERVITFVGDLDTTYQFPVGPIDGTTAAAGTV